MEENRIILYKFNSNKGRPSVTFLQGIPLLAENILTGLGPKKIKTLCSPASSRRQISSSSPSLLVIPCQCWLLLAFVQLQQLGLYCSTKHRCRWGHSCCCLRSCSEISHKTIHFQFPKLVLDICSLDHLLHCSYEPFDFAVCTRLSKRGRSVLEIEGLCKGLKSATVEGRSVICLHHVWYAEFGEDFVNFRNNRTC